MCYNCVPFAAITVTLREEATIGVVCLRECPMNLDPLPLRNPDSKLFAGDETFILCGKATVCLAATTFIVW